MLRNVCGVQVALFDMVEYYESTAELDISGNKNFGIQGWQACSKMVNKVYNCFIMVFFVRIMVFH